MPWTMYDYPDSWKNLDKLERKKAIDIGNALLKEGYKDSRAIPIATEQAKEWYKHASASEKEDLKSKHVTQHSKDSDSSGADTVDKPVHVRYKEDHWEVKSEGAKQASHTFDTKEAAKKRAEKIADNRGTKVIVHKKEE